MGSELRRARFAQGLSREQLSERTKISTARLDAIERNRVDELPPLVYLRGYLRAYAREVGLDPDDITDRYIAQFETASPAIAESPLDAAVERSRYDESPGLEEESPGFEEESFGFEEESSGFDEPSPFEAAVERDSERLYVNDGRVRTHAARARAHLPLHHDPAAAMSIAPPTRRGRYLELVVVVIAVIAIVLMIQRAGDRFERVDGGENEAVATIDAERAAAEGTANDAAPPASSVTESGDTADDVTRATGNIPESRVADDDTVANVAGDWTFSNEVVSSSLRTFRGLRLGYRIELQQQGTRITGRGVKVSENGQSLPRSRRTSIDLSGAIDGERVRLTFRETGRRRPSEGTFELQLVGENALRGTFHTDAAKSSGRAVAERDQ